MSRLIECYDIGGTQLRGVIIHNHEMIDSPIIKNSPIGSIDKLVETIFNISKELRSPLHSNQKVDTVVLGFPGPITGNYLECSPPLRVSSRVDIIKKLSVFLRKIS